MTPGQQSPYLTFGPANDTLGLTALAIGLLALVLAAWRPRVLERIEEVPRAWFVGSLALAAALLSFLYVGHYLRGGPRIVDAAAYWLEARTLASGAFAFEVPEPSGSFRGRFLLSTPEGRLGTIFPPGYPLALASGFLAGAPLAVGPLLAALLVVATHFAVRALTSDERVARGAALISALCATLRYHTADTMSHGLSALLLLMTVGCSTGTRGVPSLLLGGLFAGWLVATRPVTGAAAVLVALMVMKRTPARLAALLAGTVPGVGLLLLYQRALTGSPFRSTQLAYYSVSDGPPGCFRWGFGENVGCLFEHGDFVKENLPDGFGLLDAGFVTLERLALHTIDVANFAPLSLLVPWAAIRFRREPGVRALSLGALSVVLAYAPFYYPGSYPGGGARFFADALPLEHGLLALASTRLGIARFVPAAMLLGFALHAVHSHLALANREGGRPMFEERALEDIRHGLVFVGTDHGFLLGHDPEVRDATLGIIVARRRDDAHDRVLWERLGRPEAYRYDYDVDRGTAKVNPFRPPEGSFRFEAEAQWPPLAVARGWVHPDFAACLSGGQGLRLRPSSGVGATVEIVPPAPGRYRLEVGWLADPGARLVVTHAGAEHELAGTREPAVARDAACWSAEAFELEIRDRAVVEITSREDAIVDFFALTPADTKRR